MSFKYFCDELTQNSALKMYRSQRRKMTAEAVVFQLSWNQLQGLFQQDSSFKTRCYLLCFVNNKIPFYGQTLSPFFVQNLSNCTLFYRSRPTENNCITSFLITRKQQLKQALFFVEVRYHFGPRFQIVASQNVLIAKFFCILMTSKLTCNKILSSLYTPNNPYSGMGSELFTMTKTILFDFTPKCAKAVFITQSIHKLRWGGGQLRGHPVLILQAFSIS